MNYLKGALKHIFSFDGITYSQPLTPKQDVLFPFPENVATSQEMYELKLILFLGNTIMNQCLQTLFFDLGKWAFTSVNIIQLPAVIKQNSAN